jgi:REP element-mobilizing transposase RayT
MKLGRPSRDNTQNSICHVFQRGNNKEFLFENDKSKGMLIHNFKEFRNKFDYEILGFVIMDNHYHIIIKLNNDPLNEIMFNINNKYSKYINKSLSRSGHVFESRYNCKIIDNDSYLIWLLRYIHRNPLRAKMVSKLEDYFWSSHYFYMKAINDTINTHFILSLISNKKAKAILNYKEYVTSQGNDNNKEDDYEIMSSLFKKKLKNLTWDMPNDSIKEMRKSLDNISKEIFIDDNTKALILDGSKQRHLIPLKIAFIHEAIKLKYYLHEIADYLNCSESTACYLNKKL